MSKDKDELQKHDTITEAKRAVMQEVKMLLKDSTSDQGNFSYDFTSAAFASTILRPLMIKHGIVKSAPGSVNHGRYASDIGVDVGYRFRYTLVGAKPESGQDKLIEDVHFQDVCVEGSGKVGNSGDKGAFAACTTAGKYADLIFFYLPMVDDVEKFEELSNIMSGEEEDDTPAEPKEKPKGARKTSRKSRLKTKKQPEEEAEEPEVEDDTLRSLDMTVGEAKEVIDAFLEEADTEEEALEDIAKFVADEAELDEDDSKRRVTLMDHVTSVMDALQEIEEAEEEPEAEDEPEEDIDPDDAEILDDDGALDPDLIDYEDPEQVNELFALIDIHDDEMITELMDAFEDGEQLKSFYTVVYEKLAEESAEESEAFVDEHFPYFQERIEELMN